MAKGQMQIANLDDSLRELAGVEYGLGLFMVGDFININGCYRIGHRDKMGG